MSGEGKDVLTLFQIPDFCGIIGRASGDFFSVGGKSDATDCVGMSGEGRIPCLFPNPRFLRSCLSTGGDFFSVGGKSDAVDRAVAGEGKDVLSLFQIPIFAVVAMSRWRFFPSGEKATLQTQAVCPERVRMSFALFQIPDFCCLS